MTEQDEHKSRMERLKASVDRRIEAAQEEKGLLIVYTGAGKGKTTAALGMALRCIGHGMKVAVVQFIKGAIDTAEERFDIMSHTPGREPTRLLACSPLRNRRAIAARQGFHVPGTHGAPDTQPRCTALAHRVRNAQAAPRQPSDERVAPPAIRRARSPARRPRARARRSGRRRWQ